MYGTGSPLPWAIETLGSDGEIGAEVFWLACRSAGFFGSRGGNVVLGGFGKWRFWIRGGFGKWRFCLGGGGLWNGEGR